MNQLPKNKLSLLLVCFYLFLLPASFAFGDSEHDLAQASADRLSKNLKFESGIPKDSVSKVSVAYWINKTFQECIHFNPNNILVRRVSDRYRIVEGKHILFDFGEKKQEAQWAKSIIKHYMINTTCFVGTTHFKGKMGKIVPFMFLLTSGETRINIGKYYDIVVRGKAPQGNFSFPEQVFCTWFSSDDLVVKVKRGDGIETYVIFDEKNQLELFYFAKSLDNAMTAAIFIKMYGFNQKCNIGRLSLSSELKSQPTFTYLTQVKPAKLKRKTFEIVQ